MVDLLSLLWQPDLLHSKRIEAVRCAYNAVGPVANFLPFLYHVSQVSCERKNALPASTSSLFLPNVMGCDWMRGVGGVASKPMAPRVNEQPGTTVVWRSDKKGFTDTTKLTMQDDDSSRHGRDSVPSLVGEGQSLARCDAAKSDKLPTMAYSTLYRSRAVDRIGW